MDELELPKALTAFTEELPKALTAFTDEED
jgi:hypothetical protein